MTGGHTIRLTFVDANFDREGTMQVKEEAGNWRQATLFRSKQDRSVVLWFGHQEYEGLSGDYHFSDMHLTDSDGDIIEYRRFTPVAGRCSGRGRRTATAGSHDVTREVNGPRSGTKTAPLPQMCSGKPIPLFVRLLRQSRMQAQPTQTAHCHSHSTTCPDSRGIWICRFGLGSDFEF